MESVKINNNNELLDVEVIRYFKMNDNSYFIYTKNEEDEANGQTYLRLYATKVIGNNLENIVSEDEWNLVKEEIKKIIKGNKEGNLVIEDLNYNDLNNSNLTEMRVFKLSTALTELLKANKKEFNLENESFGVELEPITLDKIEETNNEMFNIENNANDFEQLTATPAAETNEYNNEINTPSYEEINNTPMEDNYNVNNSFNFDLNKVEENVANEVDYEALYIAEKTINERLNEEVTLLKNTLDSIKNLLI